jgi:hypothetical protein
MSALNLSTSLKLNSGHSIPQLGFGVYQTPVDEAETAVKQALDAGYRHVSHSHSPARQYQKSKLTMRNRSTPPSFTTTRSHAERPF